MYVVASRPNVLFTPGSYVDEVLERLADVVSRRIALRYSTAVNTGKSMRVDLFKVLVDMRIRITAAAAALCPAGLWLG